MRNIAKIRIAGFAAAAYAVAMVGSASAQQDTVVRRATDDPLSFGGAEYWTREMRESAVPLEWNTEPTPPGGFEAESSLNPPAEIPSSLPRKGADERAKRHFPDEWEEGSRG